MIGNPNFIDLVAKKNNDSRTGKMRVCTRVDGKLEFATLFFNEGQLSYCEYKARTGNQAISLLINSEMIAVIFIPGSGSDCIRDSSVPDIATLLSGAGHQATPASISSPIEQSDLKTIATDSSKIICGPKANDMVNKIAERYPLNEDHRKFAQECPGHWRKQNIKSSVTGINYGY